MKEKLTPWFPADVKPVRVGVYETNFREVCAVFKGFSFWNGVEWSNQRDLKEGARTAGYTGSVQTKQWRGLASNPSPKRGAK